MSDYPLVPTIGSIKGKLLPLIQDANQQRREALGRVRSIDMMRWDGTPYGPHPSQCMLLHELNDLCPRDGWPTIVFIHGGGWREGSKSEFTAFAPKIAKHGLMCASIDYRLAPESRWPAQLDDVIEALTFLRKQQVDLSRIALWGFSAGAHLALMAAHTKPEWICGVVAVAAPTDLEALPIEQTAALCEPSELRQASPMWSESKDLPPRLLVHGTNDAICPIEPVRSYTKAHNAELYTVQGGDHGLHIPFFASRRAKMYAENWLIDQMALPKRRSKWKRRKTKKNKGT